MSEKLASIFIANVKERLLEFGWTQQDLADAIGKQKAYVSHLLTGHRKPGLDTLEKISEALEVDASWLISEKFEV